MAGLVQTGILALVNAIAVKADGSTDSEAGYVHGADINALVDFCKDADARWPEVVQDAIGSFVGAASGLSATYDDAGNAFTLALTNTGVTPGAYTTADLTVDAHGRITAIADGAGGGSVLETPEGSDFSGRWGFVAPDPEGDPTFFELLFEVDVDEDTTRVVAKFNSDDFEIFTDGSGLMLHSTAGITKLAAATDGALHVRDGAFGHRAIVAAAAAFDSVSVGGTDIEELIRDTIGAALVAGSGAGVDVDDPANTITLSAMGGGSSFDKLTQEGINNGTLRLHDDTPSTGITRMLFELGEGMSAFDSTGVIIDVLNPAGFSMTGGYGLVQYGFTTLAAPVLNAWGYFDANGHEGFEISTNQGIRLGTTRRLMWASGGPQYGTIDISIGRHASIMNALHISDGSGGMGSIVASKLYTDMTAAATTPGAVQRKLEVFDETGASAGFIPIYDAIT